MPARIPDLDATGIDKPCLTQPPEPCATNCATKLQAWHLKPFSLATKPKTVYNYRLLMATVVYHAFQSSGVAFMRTLTARQQEILSLIREYINDTGFPPTRAEIAARLGFRSPNAAEEHLRALARKGMLELTSGASRGIRLLGPPVQASGSGLSPMAEASRQLGRLLQLPLVGRVAAGSPILAQEHIEQHLQLDPALFAQPPDYLLKVRGMSMRDAGILDGDLLAVHKTQNVRNGQIVVARLEGGVTVKRLQRHTDHLLLLPENPEFSPIRVDERTPDFAIEGLGVGLLRTGDAL
jgi:repressor LexA